MNIRNFTFVSLLMSMILSIQATALDRDATSIEALRFDAASYSKVDDIGFTISSETAVPNTSGAWAIVSEIGAGQLSQSSGPTYDQLHLKLGVKTYLTELTSIAMLGGYTWYDADDDFSIGSINASFRQFLTTPYAPVAPYFRVNGNLQFIEPSMQSPARQVESYRMLVVEVLAGAELTVSDNFAFVFEGGISESESLSNNGADLADGWLLRISMQYDWF